jgi:creatinine amidohydrolase
VNKRGARSAKMRTLEGFFLTSAEIKEYQKTNDMVMLGMGCFEMHGEHAIMGTDPTIDEGFIRMLAEKTGTLFLPGIPYGYTGATAPFAGTISISPEATTAYLRAVIMAILDKGFRRVLIVASHFPYSFLVLSVIRSVFMERAAAVAHLNPHALVDEKDLQEIFGSTNHWLGENGLLLGAAKYLGKENLVDPSRWRDDSHEIDPPHPVLRKLGEAKMAVGYHYTHPAQHLPSIAGMTHERGLRLLERAVERTIPVLKDLSVWADFVEKQRKEEQGKNL